MKTNHAPSFRKLLSAAFVAGLLQSTGFALSLNVYISNPNAQSSFLQGDGSLTETFDSIPLTINEGQPEPTVITGTYVSSIGTYQFSGDAQVRPANEHGGANGTQYITIGAQTNDPSPYTLTLNTEANYFGFWWSAGDDKNEIEFYKDGLFLARFSTGDIETMLKSSTITAIDNQTTYLTSEYFGNPNNGLNTQQPYAYVNIFADGLTFNQIKFLNSDATSTGFESDNHTVYYSTTPPAPEETSVLVREVEAIPEPSTTALMAAAGGALLYRMIRRRQQANA